MSQIKWGATDRGDNAVKLPAQLQGVRAKVRFTAKADIDGRQLDVRFVPKTDIMQLLSIMSGEYAPLRQLFVVRDATALSADARLKGLLDGGLTCLWEIKVHRNDISFRRTLDCIERSLAYRIVANLKGADISP